METNEWEVYIASAHRGETERKREGHYHVLVRGWRVTDITWAANSDPSCLKIAHKVPVTTAVSNEWEEVRGADSLACDYYGKGFN